MHRLKKLSFVLLIFILNLTLFAQDEPVPLPFPNTLKIEPEQRRVQAFEANGQQYVAYELLVTNFSNQPILITALHIEGNRVKEKSTSALYQCGCDSRLHIEGNRVKEKRVVFESTIVGVELANSFAPILSSTSFPNTPFLQPGESGILFLFLQFPSLNKVPEIIHNSLDIELANPFALKTISSDPIEIHKSLPIVLSHPPLEGNNWFCSDAPSNLSHHRRELFIVNGEVKQNARLAVDFLKYGPQGLFNGNPQDNNSYYTFRQEIYAVADGVIAATHDGVADNTPGTVPPLALPDLAGNYVLLTIDAHHQAFYAHLTPGSLRVKKGDKVKAGQVLGLVGNSGSSGAPHLHFQVNTFAKPIPGVTEPLLLVGNTQGIPYLFKSFIFEEYLPIGENFLGLPNTVEVVSKKKIKKQTVLSQDLVSFIKK